jgi:hypothetical protein
VALQQQQEEELLGLGFLAGLVVEELVMTVGAGAFLHQMHSALLGVLQLVRLVSLVVASVAYQHLDHLLSVQHQVLVVF